MGGEIPRDVATGMGDLSSAVAPDFRLHVFNRYEELGDFDLNMNDKWNVFEETLRKAEEDTIPKKMPEKEIQMYVW